MLFLTLLVLFKLALSVTSEERIFLCPEKNFTFIESNNTRVGDYCNRHNCIAKCCRAGEVLRPPDYTCTEDNATYDYTKYKIYKNDITYKVRLSEKKLGKDYKLVHDPKFENRSCAAEEVADDGTQFYYILEDGSIAVEMPNYYYRWDIRHKKLDFCVEILIGATGTVHYIYRLLNTLDVIAQNNQSDDVTELVVVIGMIISSVFLLLTLVVYTLLPNKRKINELIQMAYVAGLMIMFVLKAIQYFVHTSEYCESGDPLYYFFILSNYLWLAVMSFNVWWTFRGSILHRMIHRKGEHVKFLVYSLCVYGTAGAVTTFAVVVDRADLSHLRGFVKPHFSLCTASKYELMLYVYVPIAIIIGVNCILFVMTLFNIWTVKKEIAKFDANERKRNKTATNSFKMCLKLSVMMGISWIIEAAQMATDLPPKLYMCVNLINSLIGVVIFALLMTEKATLQMLCKRLNIATMESQKQSTSITGSTKGSKKSSRMETIELSKNGDTVESDLN